MEFIMMIGLPGSGKTTLAKQIAEKENAIWLSSDAIRKELYGDENIQGKTSEVFCELHKRVCESLKKGRSVVYDATNLSPKDRRGILHEIQNLKIQKRAIVVARPYEECLKTNKQRDKVVPDEVIKQMIMRFRMPYYFEGFTDIQLYYPKEEYKGFYGHYSMAFKNLMDYEQNNPWHPEGSLGIHLLNVHDNLYGKTDDPILYQAALLHDVGKPFTQKENSETGYYSFYNHANVSSYMTMFYSGLSDPIRVSAIVAYHNDTIEWLKNPKAEQKFKKKDEKFYNDLKLIGEADHPFGNDKDKHIKAFTPNVAKNKKEKDEFELEL